MVRRRGDGREGKEGGERFSDALAEHDVGGGGAIIRRGS